MLALYITHPEVLIDPGVAVPQWGLSSIGTARARAFADRRVVPTGWPIFASDERKAVELAHIIAAISGGEVSTEPMLGENDRSATGFLPPQQFEERVARFFADPARGPDGWESARSAQHRIVRAVMTALQQAGGPAVFCGHGGVGTLLKCWAGGRPIAQHEDQREIGASGGGNCIVLDVALPSLLSDWTSMEGFDRRHLSAAKA
jgi:broad specificity phosphatase PhoE